MDEVTRLVGECILTPLKRISDAKGDIYHAIKSTDITFAGFGEAYFSTVYFKIVKGWKQHSKMTLNLVVPIGHIRFHLRSADGNEYKSVDLGPSNYQRLTVPPGIWLAFEGVGLDQNLLLNVASIPHTPLEAVVMPLETFSFETYR